MKDQIKHAFVQSSGGYSADRVVVDPDLNSKYINACREAGLNDDVSILNRALLNLRKQGGLSGLPPSKTTRFDNQSEYLFASEIAIRFMERKHKATLDTVICSFELSKEFDAVAGRIAPGYSPLQYRWAALSLRKAKKLLPELVKRIVEPKTVTVNKVCELDVARIPSEQGIYIFFDNSYVLYVGESENLRKRISKHLEHSDNKGFARWIWEHGTDQLQLEVLTLNTDTRAIVRKALELELIRSRNPVFNIKR